MGFLMTLVYIYWKICAKKAKKPNEHMSHSLTQKRPAKKIKNNFGEKKSFFGPLLLLKEFRADLHMGEKGGGMKNRESFLQSCFYHTHWVFCAVGARPPRPATTAAATTAATATTAITGVVRLCNATRYIYLHNTDEGGRGGHTPKWN